jgi:uncharacterized radical SAM superfamily protein
MDIRRIAQAWDASRRVFGDDIYFYAPAIKHYDVDGYRNRAAPPFVAVSITGKNCKLNCGHCGGVLLETMAPAPLPELLWKLAERLHEKGAEGILVSGGADENGAVPLTPFLETIGKIRNKLGLRVGVHTGIVDQETAEGLARAEVNVAMLDIIGSDDTIRNVYHLDCGVEDIENSLRFLVEAGVPVSPHIVVGLDHGRIKGEYIAVEIAARYPVRSLVIVVIKGLRGAAMENVRPPSPGDALGVYLAAREAMPDTPILLGCARPPGQYEETLDRLFLLAGVNGIAYPSSGIRRIAQELGLRPHFREYCCGMVFEEIAVRSFAMINA